MDEIVEQVCAAVRKSDYEELRRILQGLVFTGATNLTRATELMTPKSEGCPIERRRREYEQDDGA